ncbi:MAG: TonB-dependent receptor [Lentisphaeraceae bacterium]|nr:TonB-dependent receptor [Lentisphaeraceae bacterium]
MNTKLVLIISILVGCCSLHAEESGDDLSLSLDKLFSLKVTSVSGTAMDMKKSPAAIYVIQNKDFKEQGHLTVADALKSVPGFHVGKVNGNTWSVGSRGFAGQFANKLLVLIDGRSVYTPLFAGVYWEIQDMVLEDIDRIEVIRGPGATLWGANAVNGVINIVTKSSRETVGGYLRLGASEIEQPNTSLRWGDQLGDDFFYRLSTKHTNKRDYDYSDGGDGNDNWDSMQFNLKTDWFVTAKDTITTIMNIQEFNVGGFSNPLRSSRTSNPFPGFAPPLDLYFPTSIVNETNWRNQNFQVEWNRALSATDGFTIKSYYDLTHSREQTLDERRDTFDIDFRHWFAVNESNDFIWGVNLRSTNDEIENSDSIRLFPDERRINSYSGFLQNTTRLDDKLTIMLGSKIGFNDQTGFEFQPSARMTYEYSEDTTFWSSISRAVRTPARTDDDLSILFPGGPAASIPALAGYGPFLPGEFIALPVQGNRDTQSEELMAYELGLRQDYFDKKLSLDLAAFYFDYSNLGAFIMNSNGTALERQDNGYGESYGVEASVKWKASKDLDFTFNYTWFKVNLHDTDESEERNNAENLFFTQMNYNLTKNLSWHTTAYYSDNIPDRDIRNYITVDTGLIWRVNDKMNFALWGKNILDPNQSQYSDTTFSSRSSDVPRTIYAEFSYNF